MQMNSSILYIIYLNIMKTVLVLFILGEGGGDFLVGEEEEANNIDAVLFFCLFSERHKSFWLTRVDMIQEPKEKRKNR
jgi:hypothetical protein